MLLEKVFLACEKFFIALFDRYMASKKQRTPVNSLIIPNTISASGANGRNSGVSRVPTPTEIERKTELEFIG